MEMARHQEEEEEALARKTIFFCACQKKEN